MTSRLRLAPIDLRAARRHIGEHHRHNLPPRAWKFGVGVLDGERLVGVGVAGRPVSKALDDGVTIEITRTCTVGAPNANSMIYGALCRAAFALGYRRVLTYTLADEPGSSLRAAGFRVDAELSDPRGWDRPKRPRLEVDLFGAERTPHGPKLRWIREAA